MGVDVLVCNLTRFGDLLQSQPLMSDLHAGGRSVGLLCLENFAPATPLLRHVDQVWTFPGARFMAELDSSWQGAAADLLAFARHVRAQARPARVLNLTPTLPARLLSRLLAPRPEETLGFGLDAEGFGANTGLWATFLGVATRQRLNAPFNIADMFRMTAQPLPGGAGAAAPGDRRFALREPPAEALAWADSFLAAGEGAAASYHVAFQLGASETRRQWPPERCAALGDPLWRLAGARPVLLGAAAEAPLAAAYARAAAHPFADAVGATDIPRLAALLRRCRLLVTNDTGTMHLAAGLGVPSLAVFVATAQPWDTGRTAAAWNRRWRAIPAPSAAPARRGSAAVGCRKPDLWRGWRSATWTPAGGRRDSPRNCAPPCGSGGPASTRTDLPRSAASRGTNARPAASGWRNSGVSGVSFLTISAQAPPRMARRARRTGRNRPARRSPMRRRPRRP